MNAWIIEKLDRERKIRDDRPRLYAPMYEPMIKEELKEEIKENRGVIIINIGGDDDEDED